MTFLILIIAVFIGAAVLSTVARRVDDGQKRSAMFAASGLLLIGAMVSLVVVLFRFHIL
ncbi:hypothetical protein [Novosphingopyxis baekryungensis]|jgi:Na+-driven multidrug efflux pump|uniref:hypothetical protein n=1 Tax=Novosphingopyxis baekryungensis TaxID=279369 RepID=UPI0003B5E506|nr:hypothetical protein [Novosphingopyxis baekryungensis]